MPDITEVLRGSRVAMLVRDARMLVVDRVSGRSTYVDPGEVDLVRLALTESGRVPQELAVLHAHVKQQLVDLGIGGPPEVRSDTLTTLILKLTSACDFACTYCYDAESSERATHLDVGLAIRAIGEALAQSERGLQVIFHGGEPMLVFGRVKAIVVEAEKLVGSSGKILLFRGQTNLGSLTQEVVAFSAAHEIRWGFSLDGPAPRNDAVRVLRKGGSTHARVQQAFDSFPAFVRRCSAMATITSANHDGLLELSRYFSGLGLPGWDWSLFQSIGRARGSVQLAYDPVVLVRSWNDLFDAIVDGEFDGFHVGPVERFVRNFLNGPGASMCKRKNCGAARDLLSISADGTIEACDCIDPRGPLSGLGNVRDTSLAAARTSPRARLIQGRNVETGKCGDCLWLAVCGGTCLARAPDIASIDEGECAITLNAYDRISIHLGRSSRLANWLAGLDG